MWIEKLSNLVYKIEKVIVMILLIAMFSSLTAGVIFRYYLDQPLMWSDELAIFSLVWLTFIGGSMSIKRQQSAAVTLLTDKLKGNWRKAIISLGFAVLVMFALYFVVISFQWLSSENIAIQKSSSMQLPMRYVYISVPTGLFFMFIHSLHLFIQSLKSAEETLE